MKRVRGSGFTLVELMIAVCIIGILAMVVVPAVVSARWKAAIARYSHDVRIAAGAFELYALEHGRYPPDRTPAVVPPGMESYLQKIRWDQPTSLGGMWDWDYQVFGYKAGVSVYKPDAPDEVLEQVDRTIDDGSLSEGIFRSRSHGYIYIIEE